MTLTFRRTAALAVLALATAPLAACGSSNDDSSNTPSTAPSSTSSSPATSDTSAPSTDTSSAPSTGDTVTPADFVTLFENSLAKSTTAKATISVKGGTVSLSGSGVEDFTTTPPSADLQLKGGGQDVHVILVDGKSYISSGTTGKFLEVDLAKTLGGGSSTLFDPKTLVPVFQKSVTKIDHVGPTTVDGQSLDEYDVTLDSKKYLAALSSSAKGVTLPQSGLPALLVEKIYFDSEGRASRIDANVGGELGSSEITYTDWGTKTDIKAPPASQVQTLPGGIPTS